MKKAVALTCGVVLVACGDSSAPTGAPDAALSAYDGAMAAVDSAADVAIDAAPPRDAGIDAPSGTDAADAALAANPSIGVPMYMDPSSPDWATAEGDAPTVSLLIANPNSGPGAAVDSSYTTAIAAAHAAGQTVVGYVHTSYGARPIADVEADIDAWYAFYPAIDGVFSDETATDAAKIAGYYAPLYAYVKAKSGKRVVVINPGTSPDEAYMTASDVVMSFEDTYAHYATFTPPAWVAKYPRSRFWHAVLSATEAEMQDAVKLARQRNVGLLFVTDQGPSTAYSQLPASAYWKAELAAVNGP